MTRPSIDAAARALGTTVARARAIGGGDINDAFEVALSDGRKVFVKINDGADPSMFPAEARGLGWLAEGRALRTPDVLAADARYLVLELLEPAAQRAGFDEELGRGLAALHKSGPTTFGLDHDNFIGRLPQQNAPLGDWPSFYRERRLLPQLAMARDKGLASRAMERGIERLCERMPELVGPPEPPARLHGDLWGGNLHVDERGAPCLIDPAAYAGHREVDLAMMKLFGGFGSRVFAAYDEAYPLAPGAAERVPLYQLYFLLAHVNLFGSGYVGSVERAIARLTPAT